MYAFVVVSISGCLVVSDCQVGCWFVFLVWVLCCVGLWCFGLVCVYCCYCRFVGWFYVGLVLGCSGTCCLIVLLYTFFYCWS